MSRWISLSVLLTVLAVVGVAVALWRDPLLPQPQQVAVTSSGMEIHQFHYTELYNGEVIYRLTGEQMHDEVGRLGSVRVAALRVIKLERVRLELLQPKVAGWVLLAEHGELLSGTRELSLWGGVHGYRRGDGNLRAGRLLVDPHSGRVVLQGGYVLNVGKRYERGTSTELSD
ncbi:MAG: LPS export ABC transporter periplasmic protein LptC [Mariprofundales bacterium]|nr:LPS export ABC transporter periplasmic protein LptC [Mariprofundales bacterium]